MLLSSYLGSYAQTAQEIIDKHLIAKGGAANNTIYNCYIDTATYTEIKRTVIAPSSGQIITVELYYSVIQPVIGVMMPFKVEMHNKKGVTYFNFVKIILNSAIDEKLFDVPSGE